MSGISGIFAFDDSRSLPARMLKEMHHSIRHRGSDDEAFIAFPASGKTATIHSGFDSQTPSKHPLLPDDLMLRLGMGMRSLFTNTEGADGCRHISSAKMGLHIVFAGNIYNRNELRQLLEAMGGAFEGNSDAELVLKAYSVWQKQCLEYFNGDWAFALWDERDGSLFCSRDRFGIQPFYYLLQDGIFFFGNEIKQLLPFLGNQQLNLPMLRRMMKINAMLNYRDETPWQGIKCLQPGEYLYIKDARLHTQHYYSLHPELFGKLEFSFEDASRQYQELLWDSIHIRSRDTQALGAGLSGGMDSTAIVCAFQQMRQKPVPTFSSYFADHPQLDERKWIDIVTQHCGCDNHLVSPTAEQAWQDLVDGTWYNDLPLGAGCAAQSAVMKLAASHNVKVLLGGQGCDEIFGGYRHAQYRFMADSLRSGKPRDFFRQFASHSKGKPSLDILSNLGKTLLSTALPESKLYQAEIKLLRFEPFNSHFLQAAGNAIPDQIVDLDSGRLDSFLFNMVYATSLQTLLHYEDRMSMVAGIHSRLPFLDHRLVELVFYLPSSYKISPPHTKLLHRHAISRWVPDPILQRTDKAIFGTPLLNSWMRNALHPQINNLFYSKEFRQRGIWNLPKIHNHWQRYLKGDGRQAEMLYNIIAMEVWLQTFIKNDPVI